MAYVYADMDALAEYQQTIVQTLSTLEGQIGCKDDLIEDTKVKIQAAIERAEEAERVAYASLQVAEEQLREAEQRTREYNSNLAEDQEPMTTPEFYYDNVYEKEREYSYAEATRTHAENTLSSFVAYVRNYEQQQADGIEHFKKLLGISGKFFEGYIKKLIEVKLCTAVAGNQSNGKSSETNNLATNAATAPAAPAKQSQHRSLLPTKDAQIAGIIDDIKNGSGKDISISRATEMWESLRNYSGEGYTEVRYPYTHPNAPQRLINQMNAVDDYVRNSPKWEGSIFRGINISKQTAKKIISDGFVDQLGPSSWSSSESEAQKFALGTESVYMVFSLKKNLSGTSITHIATYNGAEKEVLAPSGIKYIIDNVREVNQDGRRYLYVDVHE